MIISKEQIKKQGNIQLPSSKSISNRVLIIQKLCDAKFEIENLSQANDTQELQLALSSVHAASSEKNRNEAAKTEIYTGEGGTTFRFLTAYLSTQEGEWILRCSPSMIRRPVGDLVEALNNIGAEIDYLENIGFPPLKIKGRKMNGGKIPLYASVSSQFVSALCMIAPTLTHGLQIHLDGKIASSSYIRMTLSLMEYFGVKLSWKNEVIEILPQKYIPRDIVIETDWSAAAPFYQIACFTESTDLFISGLYQESLQGDSCLPEIFNELGVKTTFSENGIQLGHQAIDARSFEYDFTDCPDLVQPVAVTCAAQNIYARLKGVHNLPFKETNRIQALQNELKKFGVNVTYQNDQIKIQGEFDRKENVLINDYNDHRMVMSFVPLAVVCDSVEIENPEAVKKSFPDFFNQLLLT